MINNAPATLSDAEVEAIIKIMRGLNTSDQLLMMRLMLRMKQTHEMCEEYRVAWQTVAGSLDVEKRVN